MTLVDLSRVEGLLWQMLGFPFSSSSKAPCCTAALVLPVQVDWRELDRSIGSAKTGVDGDISTGDAVADVDAAPSSSRMSQIVGW